MKPWWFCCGWRSYWCVLDTICHAIHLVPNCVCDRHDAAIQGISVAQMRAHDASLVASREEPHG